MMMTTMDVRRTINQMEQGMESGMRRRNLQDDDDGRSKDNQSNGTSLTWRVEPEGEILKTKQRQTDMEKNSTRMTESLCVPGHMSRRFLVLIITHVGLVQRSRKGIRHLDRLTCAMQ